MNPFEPLPEANREAINRLMSRLCVVHEMFLTSPELSYFDYDAFGPPAASRGEQQHIDRMVRSAMPRSKKHF